VSSCLVVTRSEAAAVRLQRIAADVGFDPIEVMDSLGPAIKSDERRDVLIIDFSIGEDACLEACATAVRRAIAHTVAVVGPANYPGVRRFLSLGAKGYLSVESDDAFFRSALRALEYGYMVLDPHVTQRLVALVVKGLQPDTGLSDRELEIIRHVGNGESNKQIAKALGLSENSVKTYVARAFDKLGCHSRPEAAAALARIGLL
jgi:DNA-binding NarL/FixJ family response regulator